MRTGRALHSMSKGGKQNGAKPVTAKGVASHPWGIAKTEGCKLAEDFYGHSRRGRENGAAA